MPVVTLYSFDYDYKCDRIKNKYKNPFFKDLPRILMDLSIDDHVYKILMSNDITIDTFIQQFNNVKSIQDIKAKAIEILNLRGANIEY